MSQQGEVFCFLSSLGRLTGYEAKPPHPCQHPPPPTGCGPSLTIVSLTGLGAGALALGGNRRTIRGWGLDYQGPEGTRRPRRAGSWSLSRKSFVPQEEQEASLGGASSEGSRSGQGEVGWAPEEMTQGFRLFPAPITPAYGPESSPELVSPHPLHSQKLTSTPPA